MQLDREELVAEGPGLYRFALSITRNPDRAADLVQDTFARALERSDQFREGAPLGPWLRRILHNIAVDTARRARREVIVEEIEERWMDDAYTIDPSVIAEQTQTRAQIEDALTRIPFIYRAVLVLHDVDGWTVREIAELQGVSLPAAKQRLRRGRMALTTALADGRARMEQLKGVPMHCWDARQHVSDYLDGILDEGTRDLVELHLSVCPTCPPLYASLVDTHAKVSSLRDPDRVIPPSVQERIRLVVAGH